MEVLKLLSLPLLQLADSIRFQSPETLLNLPLLQLADSILFQSPDAEFAPCPNSRFNSFSKSQSSACVTQAFFSAGTSNEHFSNRLAGGIEAFMEALIEASMEALRG